MNETNLDPYRTPDLAIAPISSDLIPDCDEEETIRINGELKDISGRFDELALKRDIRAFLKAFLPGLGATAIMTGIGIFMSGVFPWMPIGLAAVVVCLVVASISADCAGLKPLADTEEVRALTGCRAKLQDRLSILESLERLTGKSARATELRREICAFNDDLARQDQSLLTASDQALIAARRGELMKKVGDFRETALGLPEHAEPLQLPSPHDA